MKVKFPLSQRVLLSVIKTYYFNKKNLKQMQVQALSDAKEGFFVERLKFKIAKIEYILEIIDIVLENISPVKKRFFYLRYEKKFSVTKISMQLNVSPTQIAIWDQEILVNIMQMVKYEISLIDDIFALPKIGAMIGALEHFILKIRNLSYVDKKYLNNLLSKRMLYIKYYGIIAEELERIGEEKRKIIEERIGEDKTLKEIADKYAYSTSSISIFIKDFRFRVTRKLFSSF